MTEPIDADTLARRVREHRASRGLSLRAGADESGVPFNTLSRVEKGHLPDLANFARLVTWIGQDPAEFFRGTPRQRPASTTAAVRDLLHDDPLLTEQAAEQIAGLVSQLYGTLATAPTGVAHLHAATTFTPQAATLLSDVMGRLGEAVFASEYEPGWAA